MKTNTTTLAAQIACLLDEKDKNGKDGRIEASIWNAYVTDKGGRTIRNYIDINNAIKSLATYLYRQAKEKSTLIKKLGQDWIDLASANNTVVKNPNNTQKGNSKKKVDTSYSKMSRTKALKKAQQDKRLEELSGGDGWSVAKDSFITDIPFAKKFTGKILSIVSRVIGEDIVVTSALGTGGNDGKKSTHTVSKNYCTHHNAENPKLDIRTNGHPEKLRKKLIATGLFSRVAVEPDHLDIQIKAEVYKVLEYGYKLENILSYARKNMLERLMG